MPLIDVPLDLHCLSHCSAAAAARPVKESPDPVCMCVKKGREGEREAGSDHNFIQQCTHYVWDAPVSLCS